MTECTRTRKSRSISVIGRGALRLTLTISVLLLALECRVLADTPPLALVLRSRVAVEGDASQYRIEERAAPWDPAKTAVVICDMWDLHHCKNAASRVADMAPRVNEVVKRLRQQGVLIIHCPSDTMKFYENHSGRKLAQSAPPVKTNVLAQGWCSLDKQREAKLPIDDSDGGCDTPSAEQQQFSAELKAMGRNPGAPWTRQIEAIEIKEGDAITDGFQAYYLMKQRGISNVIMMGVHTNMCVLGRAFGIRQMVRQGQNVVLVRDLTDTMYNPARAPLVSHFTGTDLVVEHIEKYWCPTITSDQLIGGKPFRFKADQRKRLVLVLAEEEYRTTATVPGFAARYLGREFQIERVLWEKNGAHSLSGLSALAQADVALFSLWRRTLPKQQLDQVRKYLAAGKPLVAIRTSSHGFASRDGKAPPGHEQWPGFDQEILGGHYQGHHGNHGETPEKTTYIWVPKDRQAHPILQGVAAGERATPSWLYKMSPLGKQTQVLLMGRVGSRQPHEPVAWTNVSAAGGRVFYTSLGHPKEFESQDVQRLLFNAVHWAAGLDVPREMPRAAASPTPTTPSSAGPHIQFPKGAASVVVPIARGDMLIFVRPTINDQEAGWFILDTGAGNNIIDTGVAQKLGLKAVGRSSVGGAGGKRAEATIFQPQSFRLNQAKVRQQELVGVDLTHLTTGRGIKTCGLIGYDVFGAGPFTVDYAKQTLTLHDPKQFQPPQDAREWPLIVETPRLNANIRVDGRFDGKVMLDTGYEGGVLLNGGYLCRFYDLFAGRKFRTTASLGISGQPVSSRSDMLKSIELFGRTVEHVSADFPPEPLTSDPKSTYSRMGILGGLMLRHYRITYDYASQRAWVKWQGDDELPASRPAGFDINARDLMGLTALCRAARWGNTDVTLKLLAAGADPRIADLTSRTPIHMAAERGDTRLAAALLKAGVAADIATEEGITPLMLAAQEDHTDFARAMLAAGAKLDARAKNGTTAIILAATFGREETLSMLLDADKHQLIQQEANDGLTPLMAASLGGHVATACLLLKRGADPKAVAQSDGWTALMCAAQSDNVALIDLLIGSGADAAIRDRNGRTALDIARGLGRKEAARRLERP